MVPRKQALGHRFRSLSPFAAVLVLAAGVLTSAAPSAAGVSTVAGGAAGETVNVSLSGGPRITSGPLPSVTLQPSGRRVNETAPSVSVKTADALTPVRWSLLEAGPLSVTSQGSTGWGASTSSASAADVEAMDKALTASRIRSTCTSSEEGSMGSATISGGTLALSGSETIKLPPDPAPNTTFTATHAASGDTVTVILNEQRLSDRSITVSAVHLILDGPSAVGDIVVGQSWCATRPGRASSTTAARSSASDPTPPPAGVEGEADRGDDVLTAAADAPATAAAISLPAAAPAQAGSPAVRGSACAYIVNVGLFGGPQTLRGCGQAANAPAAAVSPSVMLPPEGSATAITQNDSDGAKADYGPATIFGGLGDASPAPPSGPLSASTQGTPGGSVTSSADIVLRTPADAASPGGFGPSFPSGKEMHVKCSAAANELPTGTTSFVDATLATATDGEGEATVTEQVPANPQPNYTRSGVITNVGDVFTVVFNEQIWNADGSLTVNAVHSYLFGPTAVGELIIGQVTCGTTPSPAAPKDERAPTCGTPVVKPLGPEDPTPATPLSVLIGVFDAGGLQSITNPQATNGTLTVPPAGTDYLSFKPGQTGPLPISAVRTDEAQPLAFSFDAVDVAGNTTSVAVSGTPPALVCTVKVGTSGGPADPPGSSAPGGGGAPGGGAPGGGAPGGGAPGGGAGGNGAGGTGSGGTGAGSSGRGSMASTGFGTSGALLLGFSLLVLGAAASFGGARLSPVTRTKRRLHDRA